MDKNIGKKFQTSKDLIFHTEGLDLGYYLPQGTSVVVRALDSHGWAICSIHVSGSIHQTFKISPSYELVGYYKAEKKVRVKK